MIVFFIIEFKNDINIIYIDESINEVFYEVLFNVSVFINFILDFNSFKIGKLKKKKGFYDKVDLNVFFFVIVMIVF